MKKMLFVSFLMIVFFLMFLFSAIENTAQAKDKIVVGMSRPLSGPMAKIGDSAFRPVYETFVAEVNAQGGIFVKEFNKKLPIELKVYDDKSDTGTMTRLTEKLILEDKVDFLWPACGTHNIFAQAPIANKYGYILMTAEGGATSIRPMLQSLPYLFVSLSFSDWYQIPVFAELIAEKGAKTAYIISMADLFGIEYSGVSGIELPKRGINIVGLKSVPPDIKDLSPILKEAQKTKADALMVLAYPDAVILATKQSMELGYNPKAFLTGPGGNFGFYHQIFGPAAEGVMGFTMANRKTSPAFKELFDKLYKDKPVAANDWWGHPIYWAAYEFWKQAVEKAGTLDQKKIREIMAADTFDTVLGPTSFKGGLMAKESHTGEIGQWQKGVYETVGGGKWPNTKITAPFLYPKPPWPKPAPAKK